jgi:hypothetical protein
MYSMCNLNVVEDEYHFILQCEKYIDVRRRYLKKYYWQMPSCFKLVQLLSLPTSMAYSYTDTELEKIIITVYFLKLS